MSYYSVALIYADCSIYSKIFLVSESLFETFSVTEDSGQPGLVSVVVPLLDEADSLRELSDALQEAILPVHKLEILFIDDGSTDGSWEVIQNIVRESESHPELSVSGVRLRRNYGKSTALHLGFKRAQGSYIATIDADMQDDPFEIPEMIKLLDEGKYDLVSGWKQKRKDPLSKTIPSLFFNKVTAIASGIALHDFNCGLKVYRGEVVRHLTLYGEMHRYIPLLAKWQGFSRITEKPVKHHPRKYGTTKFGATRFIKGFLDLLTLIFMRFFEQRPMHFFGTAGFISAAAGAIITLYLIFMKIVYNEFLSRRPLLLIGVLLIVVGFQFFSVGLIGEMIVRGKRKGIKPNIAEDVQNRAQQEIKTSSTVNQKSS